jgi:hypothetical protein
MLLRCCSAMVTASRKAPAVPESGTALPRPDTHALHIMPSKPRDKVNEREGTCQMIESTNCLISRLRYLHSLQKVQLNILSYLDSHAHCSASLNAAIVTGPPLSWPISLVCGVSQPD